MKTTDKRLLLLTNLCYAQLWLESYDEIQNSKAFKHELKRKGNMFAQELEAWVKNPINKVFETDNDTTNAIMIGMEELIKKMAKLDPSDFVVAKKMIEMLENGELDIKEDENVPTL
jgi:hypothetical protein